MTRPLGGSFSHLTSVRRDSYSNLLILPVTRAMMAMDGPPRCGRPPMGDTLPSWPLAVNDEIDPIREPNGTEHPVAQRHRGDAATYRQASPRASIVMTILPRACPASR